MCQQKLPSQRRPRDTSFYKWGYPQPHLGPASAVVTSGSSVILKRPSQSPLPPCTVCLGPPCSQLADGPARMTHHFGLVFIRELAKHANFDPKVSEVALNFAMLPLAIRRPSAGHPQVRASWATPSVNCLRSLRNAALMPAAVLGYLRSTTATANAL